MLRITHQSTLRAMFGSSDSIFEKFLNTRANHLTFKRQAGRLNNSLSEVFVPHHPLSRETVQAFFEKHDIKKKIVLINVDSSHLMGMRRLLIRQHFEKNVYKGQGSPVDELAKHNPSIFIDFK